MSALKWLVGGLVSCLVMSSAMAVSFAESTPVNGRVQTAPLTAELDAAVTSGQLILPGAQFMFGNEQSQAQMRADRTNPMVVHEREASRTSFEDLSPAQAATVASKAFPEVVNQPDGGTPPLGSGERIVGYSSVHAAQISFPDGKHGVVESWMPLAKEISPGKRVSINLALHKSGDTFQATTNDVAVHIPKQLRDGVSLPELGVSLTPVDASEQPLTGAGGKVDGSSVFYGDTGGETDTLVKPTTSGFEEDTLLRSVNSPQQLHFHVGLPSGDSLVAASDGQGGAEVIAGGRVIATIPAATAYDAEGTAVPVTTRVSSSTLYLTVHHHSGGLAGNYRYPIDVDPWVIDKEFRAEGELGYDNLAGATNDPSAIRLEGSEIVHNGNAGDSPYKAGDYGYVVYPTQKESHIFAYYLGTYIADTSGPTQTKISIASPGAGVEGEQTLPNWGSGEHGVCAEGSCEAKLVTAKNKENRAFFETYALEGSNEYFNSKPYISSIYIDQDKGPTAGIDTTDSTLNGKVNAGSGKWVSTKSGSSVVLGVKAFDPGTGVNTVGLKSPNKSGWGYAPQENRESECAGYFEEGSKSGVQCNECYENECVATGVHSKPFALPLGGLGELPQGEDTVEATVQDAVGLSAVAKGTVKVDNEAPHNITFTGLPAELAAGEYHLKAEATDGSSAPSAGVKSIALLIDGAEVGTSAGACEPGPCTGKNEWTIAGRTFAVGTHTATVVATDNAGNVGKEEVTFKVSGTGKTGLGPGEVNLASGEFSLSSTDVSLGGGLTVGRTYSSRHLNNGGIYGVPLGHEWNLTLGGSQMFVMQPNESMILANAGSEAIFAKKGTTYEPPSGNANLKLVPQEKSGTKEYVLKNEATGTSTIFTQPSKSGSIWVPTVQQGLVATDTVTYSYTTDVFGTRPTEALAPVPAGVSCSPELKPGCRALTFTYGGLGTNGENESEWGEAFVHLKEITYWAYNPTTKAMAKTVVAQYAYDKQLRLRAEWDPRVSPALKTKYGYDAEGHLTALTPPGQESWAFTYGTIPTDSGPGRLIKVNRAPASAPLWNGLAPAVTTAPKISGSPRAGTLLSVTSGAWTNNPVSYSYTWEDCNSSGAECKPIAGATSVRYRPVGGDVGHALRVSVAAINGWGSVVTQSIITVPVAELNPIYTASFGSSGTGNGQLKTPWGLAMDSSGNVWVSDTGNSRVEEFNSAGTFVRTVGSAGTGNGQFTSPEAIAVDPHGNIWVADSGNNRVEEFSSTGTYIKSIGSAGSGNGQFKNPEGIAFDVNGDIWVADNGNNRIQEFNEKYEYQKSVGTEGTGNGQFKGPSDIAIDSEGNLWVSDQGNGRIEKFSSAGTYVAQFGVSGSGNGQFISAWRMSMDPEGNLWIGDSGNSRVQVLTANGQYAGKFGSLGSGAGQFSGTGGVGIHGLSVYVLDHGNSRIEKWVLPVASEGEALPAAPGSTVEYNVPLSGVGLPTMTESEVKRWGQTDIPVEASAIFPPDKAQGWPVASYERAGLYYLDAKGHVVNLRGSQGGIGTSEYNSSNEVVRSLSPDNREAALKEGAKSAEVSKLIDAENTYNGEGTELESTLGPRHLLKLGNGKEVQARNHTVYSYDEGAPAEGGPYRLVTKTTQGVTVEGEAEQDVRTTVTSYSGQGNLGWKLREPTSTTVDPSGLHLTHTTVYNETTGNVLESTTPEGTAENAGPAFVQQFGVEGTGKGQLKNPKGMAIDLKGNIWVADDSNSRLEEFTPSGEYVGTLGSFGTGNGQFNSPKGIAIDSKGNMWVVDTVNNRIQEFTEKAGKYEYLRQVGSLGSEAGKFNEPKGIAVDSHNNVWVTDSKNNRVEEFSETGTYLKAVGKTGFGNGELSEPRNAVVDAKGNIWVGDTNNNRIEEFNEKGEYVRKFGSEGSGNGQLKGPQGIALDAKGNVWIVDTQNNRVQEFSEAGTYLSQFGAIGTGVGQFTEPRSITIDSHGNFWVADTNNNRIERWISNKEGAHTSQTIYYATAANAKYPNCGEHPEWAELVCQTQPAAQPETSGMPSLPVTTIKYNMWEEPETVTSTAGSATETATIKYDSAGRETSSALSSSIGTALPTVTTKYDEHLGLASEESTVVEGKTQSLKSVYNTLGQATSYTEANGTTSTFEYEKEGDARLTSVNDGKGTQSYTYSTSTGEITSLKDTAAAAFTLTATYDADGNLLTEGYPNGMKASYAYNQAGTPVSVEYEKTTHCTEKCIWFKDSIVPSSHGQWATQTSTQATNKYTYDNSGRLTQVQDEAVGKGCTTRIYGYDEDTNRTSLTTRAPGGAGECTTTGGSVEYHTYDSADRLLDAGSSYDGFGNILKLPSADSGGSPLESSFYSDNQLASQTQAGETVGYSLDPAGRVRETVSSGKVAATIVNHYAGSGSIPSWTSELSGNTSRNIFGLDGNIVATQNNVESPVLQIVNLHGDVVGTASMSETATGLASTVGETSEYGVPVTEAPAKYSWLGAGGLTTQLPSLPSGVVTMGVRSYVPQIGRFLQTDPIPGGSANAYAYTYGDPVDQDDLSGMYSAGIDQFDEEYVGGRAEQAAETRAAEVAAALAEAERKAEEAAQWPGIYLGDGGPELPLGGYPGWACEYAEETGQEAEGCGGGGSPVSLKAKVAASNVSCANKQGQCHGGASSDAPTCSAETPSVCNRTSGRPHATAGPRSAQEAKKGHLNGGDCSGNCNVVEGVFERGSEKGGNDDPKDAKVDKSREEVEGE
jgi:RHS repeat-associated protein